MSTVVRTIEEYRERYRPEETRDARALRDGTPDEVAEVIARRSVEAAAPLFRRHRRALRRAFARATSRA